jgi:hypothetical protein
MAADQRQPGVGGMGGPFEVLDATLNIYALANGMDLVKEPGRRTLGWYREGLERGILIEASGTGALSVSAACWKTSDPSVRRTAPQHEAILPDHLASHLSATLEAALEAANGLSLEAANGL